MAQDVAFEPFAAASLRPRIVVSDMAKSFAWLSAGSGSAAAAAATAATSMDGDDADTGGGGTPRELLLHYTMLALDAFRGGAVDGSGNDSINAGQHRAATTGRRHNSAAPATLGP